MALCGGISNDAKEVNDGVREICEKIRDAVEAKAGVKYEEFTPIVFKTQVVNGTNYFIKVRVASESYIHVRVHQSLPHNGSEITYHSHQENKAEGDDVTHF